MGGFAEMSPSLARATARRPGEFAVYVPTNYLRWCKRWPQAGQPERINVLEDFFILSRGNQNGVPTWFGVAYVVFAANSTNSSLYSLYGLPQLFRVGGGRAAQFVSCFISYFSTTSSQPTKPFDDGVVELACALRCQWRWMNQCGCFSNASAHQRKCFVSDSKLCETGFAMFSNTLPAAVEVKWRARRPHAATRRNWPNNSTLQSNYLAARRDRSTFPQRVSIPNVDRSAYQMKLHLRFTIYDLRFAKIVASVAANPQSAIRNPQSQKGIALVITLILLAVTLVWPSRSALSRAKRAVTTSTDTASRGSPGFRARNAERKSSPMSFHDESL